MTVSVLIHGSVLSPRKTACEVKWTGPRKSIIVTQCVTGTPAWYARIILPLSLRGWLEA